jgi:hypothetical protein
MHTIHSVESYPGITSEARRKKGWLKWQEHALLY